MTAPISTRSDIDQYVLSVKEELATVATDWKLTRRSRPSDWPGGRPQLIDAIWTFERYEY